MTIELTCLMLTALLAASLWIPFVIGVNTTPFDHEGDVFVTPPDVRTMRPWVQRAYRAHLNLLEQFLPFAVIVLIGYHLGVSTAITQTCAVAFLLLRIAHAVGMITAIARNPSRPIIFTAGYIATLVYAWQVFAHAG